MSIFNTARNSAIENAVAGFVANRAAKNLAPANNAMIQDFRDNVEKSIDNSYARKEMRYQAKGERVLRQDRVELVAADNNIRFIHRRQKDFFEDVVIERPISKTETHLLIRQETVTSAFGGATLAYKYRLDEDNNLFIVYSVAFCNPVDNFDPLVGKEISIAKFLAGDTMEFQVSHDRLGDPKLLQITNNYQSKYYRK